MTSSTQTKLTLKPEYQGITAVLVNQGPENARKRYTVAGFPSYYQGRHYLVNGEPHVSVTKLLNDTVPKQENLVPWAKGVALEKAKQEFLDLNPFNLLLTDDATKDNNDSLWHQFVNETIENARNRPDEIRDEAADWGVGAHKMLQRYIEVMHLGIGMPGMTFPYQGVLQAFYEFEKTRNITWLATELVLWDSDLKVAGTVDAVGRTSDGLVCFDWKTVALKHLDKDPYDENAIQVSAYSHMLEELYGEPVVRAYVVRFPREQPEPEECDCYFPEAEQYYVPDCPKCGGKGSVTPTLFHVSEVADLAGGYASFERCVVQAQWAKSQIWRK